MPQIRTGARRSRPTQGLRWAAPPSRKSELPQETLELSSETLSLATQPKPEPGWGRRLAKIGLGALSLSGSIAGVGTGLAVMTNYEVVQEAFTQTGPVYGFARDLNASQTSPEVAEPTMVNVSPNGDISRLQNHLDVTTTETSLTANLEGEKAQAVLNTLRQSQKVQTALNGELAEVQVKINQKLRELNIKPGEALLEARIPFPTGEGSLIQLGQLDIPVGLNQLEMEELPLVLKYELDTLDSGVQVELQPTEVERAPLPQGVRSGLHLVSARAEASHPDLTQTRFSGRVKLALDDGSATRRALEKTHDPARRALLESRLERIERLQGAIEAQNLGPLLDFALGHRELTFDGHLAGPGENMGQGEVHAWLVPDQDGDQRADVRLASKLELPVLQVVQYQAEEVNHAATRESGLAGRLQDEISARIETAAKKALPSVLDGLRGTIDGEVRKAIEKELVKAEGDLNRILDETLDSVAISTQGVGLDLSTLDVERGSSNLKASLRSTEGTLRETLGPRVTVRKRPHNEEETPVLEMEPMVLVPASDSSAIALKAGEPTIVVPGASARRFLGSILENPETQAAFDSLTLGARQQLGEKASNLPGLSGSIHLDVEIPFPSRANVASPLGPIPQMEAKNVPLRADYEVDSLGIDLKLQARLRNVDQAVRPRELGEDAVFLGAISVASEPFTSEVNGRVGVQKLETEGGAPWAETALDEAFLGQNFDFETEVSLDETEAMFYLWLGPDTNGDGRADVAISHRTLNTGAEGVAVTVKSVNSEQGELALSSRLGGRLNGIVNRVVQTQIQQSAEKLRGVISTVLENEVDGLLEKGSDKIGDLLNERLPGMYQKLENLEVPLPRELAPGGNLDVGLNELTVSGDSLIVSYGDQRTAELLRGTEPAGIQARELAPGELVVSLPGELVNRLVADQAVGGPMDWNSVLNQAVKGSGVLKSLKLATDQDGVPLSPSLKMVDGQPTLSLAVDGQTNGLATPVTAGARKLPGFLGDGLGWLTEHTAGALLGSRLRGEVQVPVEFALESGALEIHPGEARLVEPEAGTKRRLEDYLPTRALSSLITDALARSLGPKVVNKMLSQVEPTVDPSALGLQWSRIEAEGEDGQAPTLLVGVSAAPNMPNLLVGTPQ